ncbi:MAG TPA: DUF5680 domain-containing protein [Candidatus Limnocylindrales bacterium]|nr:DUF5680 domain-containing protein [Candidatus Limnocylindrales bacterium]
MASHEELRHFLYDTTQAGYGNPNTRSEKASDGANIITYEDGEWRMVDSFYGGHPYAGQEVVYHLSKAVWAMQYRGWVHDTEMKPSEVYGFLKKALVAAPAEHPYRGPRELQDGSLVYRNEWNGEIDGFAGQEVILDCDQEIYRALYFGGVVDQ